MKAKIIALLKSIRVDTLLLAIIATMSCLSYMETQYMKRQIRYIESSLSNISNNTDKLDYIDSSLDKIESSISWIEHYISLR